MIRRLDVNILSKEDETGDDVVAKIEYSTEGFGACELCDRVRYEHYSIDDKHIAYVRVWVVGEISWSPSNIIACSPYIECWDGLEEDIGKIRMEIVRTLLLR